MWSTSKWAWRLASGWILFNWLPPVAAKGEFIWFTDEELAQPDLPHHMELFKQITVHQTKESSLGHDARRCVERAGVCHVNHVNMGKESAKLDAVYDAHVKRLHAPGAAPETAEQKVRYDNIWNRRNKATATSVEMEKASREWHGIAREIRRRQGEVRAEKHKLIKQFNVAKKQHEEDELNRHRESYQAGEVNLRADYKARFKKERAHWKNQVKTGFKETPKIHKEFASPTVQKEMEQKKPSVMKKVATALGKVFGGGSSRARSESRPRSEVEVK